jgi:hypothetical protein
MIRARTVWVAALAGVSIGCAGSHSRRPGDVAPAGGEGGAGQHVLEESGSGGVTAEQSGSATAASGAPRAASGAGAGGKGGGSGMPGPRGTAAADASRVVPEFAETGVGMWVGELWSFQPMLCDPRLVEGYPDPMLTADGYRWRVFLILDSDGEQLEGRIAFGEGELPSAPSDLPGRSSRDHFWSCSSGYPAVGGVYTIRSAVQRQQRLTFEIAPNEIWDGWCQRERYICTVSTCGARRACTCNGDMCGADVADRVIIDLSAKADELEGFVLLDQQRDLAELRLYRVR